MRIVEWILHPLLLTVVVAAVACRASPAASPSPTPPPGPGLSLAEMKYVLIARFGDVFFCDPDYYPVARPGVEEQHAAEQFPVIEAQTEEFQAILRHINLQGVVTFTDDQRLLVYREHKRLGAITLEQSGTAYVFRLRVEQQEKLQGLAIEGTITPQGAITVTKQEPTITTCPICLSGATRIQTPGGEVAVRDLKAGILVWTVDALGNRVAAPVVEILQKPAPMKHEMVWLDLDDGRELVASAAHPLTDGRVLGEIRVGDWLDGARVAAIAKVDWSEPATYDLLPEGETGWYWANGILVASTLAPR